jgi:hypothetical protein
MSNMPQEFADYLRTMISPEERTLTTTEGGECVYLHVSTPDTFPWGEHGDASVHGMTVEASSLAGQEAWVPEVFRILKPGAHLMLVAPDEEPTGHTGACVAEDAGFEVRDAILWVEGAGAGDRLHYTAKAARAEREAGLYAEWGEDENEGGKRKNVHPCLHPDALVLTERGYRPIQTVQVGDKVYGENGQFNPVSHVSHHPHTSPNLYEVAVDGTNYTLLATDNHPFLIWRPTRKGKSVTGGVVAWVPGEEVRAGDYTMTPVPTFTASKMSLDAEGWFLFGLYLADGVLHRGGHGSSIYPSFTVGDTKPHNLARIEAYGASRGVKVGVYEKAGAKAKQVILFDADMGALFASLGGHGAEGKALASDVWAASPTDRATLLQGYLSGDGCRVNGRKYLQAKTVSPDLASHLTLLGEEAGYKVCLYRYEGGKGKGIAGRMFKSVLPVYHLYFYEQNLAHEGGAGRKPSRPTTVTYAGGVFSLRRVSAVTLVPYAGEVWNLTVDGSHTFHTPVGMTHNTVKPTEVMSRLLADISKDKGPVLDPFLGSGTTLLACVETGHDGIGIEREREYLEIADARVRHRDYETAGWNRATIHSDVAPPPDEKETAVVETSLDDFFGL